jgi:hypothetical protein
MSTPLLPRCSWCYMGAGVLRTTRGTEPARLCRPCFEALRRIQATCDWCKVERATVACLASSRRVNLCRSCSDVLGWPPGRVPANTH